MVNRHTARLLLSVLALAPGGVALAQSNISNEVWLGQIGTNNTLDIVQEGIGNAAGADDDLLRLGQDGENNVLTLDQYGYYNRLGTLLFENQPNYARGVWQRGDANRIDISQRNPADAGTALGANLVGSVRQYSRLGLGPNAPLRNLLTILQSTDADAALVEVAGHYVGRIVQINPEAAGEANEITITQLGVGVGNVLANLRQQGSGNLFTALQQGQNNRIGEPPPYGELPSGGARQHGVGNTANIEQDGTNNLLEYFSQYGTDNQADIAMFGDGNLIAHVLQNNEGSGSVGNVVHATISGTGNGGNTLGMGWVGELLGGSALGVSGVVQSVLQQLGDDNDIHLAIESGVENTFGISQFGDGNTARVLIGPLAPGAEAARNETAIFQSGDNNFAVLAIAGNENTAAIRQQGSNNDAEITMHGDLNNGSRNGIPFTLFGPAGDLLSASAGALQRGVLDQQGRGNSALVDIFGSDNRFALTQAGDYNQIKATILNTGNALAVLQQGHSDTSWSTQSGIGNALSVHQF